MKGYEKLLSIMWILEKYGEQGYIGISQQGSELTFAVSPSRISKKDLEELTNTYDMTLGDVYLYGKFRKTKAYETFG